MKKDTVTPVRVYRDEANEAATRIELEKARNSLQVVLNKWLALGLGSCKDISDLILRPRILYDQAVNDLLKVPESEGPFKLDKNKYKDQLTLPDPSGLLEARNEALKQSYCTNSELWNLSGDRVVLNDWEAEYLIDSQSIYLSDPAKIQLAEDLKTLVDAMNKINLAMSGELLPPAPHVTQFCRGKFLLTQKSYPGPFEMSVDPEFLRSLIQR